jgi:hypothetical protein
MCTLPTFLFCAQVQTMLYRLLCLPERGDGVRVRGTGSQVRVRKVNKMRFGALNSTVPDGVRDAVLDAKVTSAIKAFLRSIQGATQHIALKCMHTDTPKFPHTCTHR